MSCLVLGLALSMHLGLANDYNQTHPYAVCETDKTIVGAYYNSLDKTSLVGAYKYELTDEVTLDLGIVTGYLEDYPVVPMARLRYKNFFAMPAVEPDDDRVGIVVGLQFNFKERTNK